MVKTWSADNPKAALMARKREVIVAAALQAFLENGYAESSVNRIAADAGVSIKTLYRHFESKDDLFTAVMHAACESVGSEAAAQQDPTQPAWYAEPPAVALPAAGREYLQHALSAEQLALYRVVTRDAHRFPELGRRYREEVTSKRDAVFVGYLDRWAPTMGWQVADKLGAAAVFVALLSAGILDETLHGLSTPSAEAIERRAEVAAGQMLGLFKLALL